MKIRAELTFPRELKDEPIFYEIVKKFNVIPTIKEASFSTEVGWAYLTIEGEEENINRLFEYLATKNIIIDKRG